MYVPCTFCCFFFLFSVLVFYDDDDDDDDDEYLLSLLQYHLAFFQLLTNLDCVFIQNTEVKNENKEKKPTRM